MYRKIEVPAAGTMYPWSLCRLDSAAEIPSACSETGPCRTAVRPAKYVRAADAAARNPTEGRFRRARATARPSNFLPLKPGE